METSRASTLPSATSAALKQLSLARTSTHQKSIYIARHSTVRQLALVKVKTWLTVCLRFLITIQKRSVVSIDSQIALGH